MANKLAEMEAFAEVVARGGFSEAARAMGVSKSSISKQVASLEARLGVLLLRRTTRRVEPTEAGIAYYERAIELLAGTEEADRFAAGQTNALRGTITIAAADELASLCLVEPLGAFLAKHAGLRLYLEDLEPTRALDEGLADLALMIGPPRRPGIRARPLFRSEHKLVASLDYIAAAGAPEAIEDLRAHRLLGLGDRHGADPWQLIGPAGDIREVRAGDEFVSPSMTALLGAALRGIGIALLPDYLVAGPLDANQLAQVLPGLAQERVMVHAACLSERAAHPALVLLTDHLIDHFRS